MQDFNVDMTFLHGAFGGVSFSVDTDLEVGR